MLDPASLPNLPHDLWGFLGLALLTLVGQFSGTRKVRKHTDTATARQTEQLVAEIGDVNDRVDVVAYALARHVDRPGHTPAGEADPPPDIAERRARRRHRGGATG